MRETPDAALRLGAYDHTFLAGGAVQAHAVRTYQAAGLAGFVLPFETCLSRMGPLVVLRARPDDAFPTRAAIVSAGLSIAGEDRNGDGRLDPSRDGNDALALRPSGPGVVTVERLCRGGLALEVVAPMAGRATPSSGVARPASRSSVRSCERFYRARFETAPAP